MFKLDDTIAMEAMIKLDYDEDIYVEANPFGTAKVSGVFTPATITNTMLSKINVDSSVLVVHKTEMVIAAINSGVPAKNITLLTNDKSRTADVTGWGVSVVTNFEACMNKFDAIIMNPPYAGKARLHQKFFNNAVAAVKEGGSVVSIHPATPYFNKKDTNKHDELVFAANVRTYNTSVEFLADDVFDSADITTGLAITNLTKIKSNAANISSVKYVNGTTYDDVPLENIHMTEINPDDLVGIWNKFVKVVNSESGSLQDNKATGDTKKAYLQKLRGHNGTDDFYTLVSKDSKYHHGIGDFGVAVNNKTQRDNFYEYAKSNVARFGLALLKFNGNLANGELAMIPMVDLDYQYEEEYLYDMLGLTKKEIKIIEDFLPNYYG